MRSIMGLFTTRAVMRRRIVMACAAAVLACAASAEAQDAERWQEKQRRSAADAPEAGPDGLDSLLPPSRSTSTRDYLGIEVHQGGVYEPSTFPSESWLEVACIHHDLTRTYDRARHGFSIVWIHALVYDADLDEIYDTTDTTASDEALCSVNSTIDTSFIELPRAIGRQAAMVALIFAPRADQYVEASKIVYRILPR